MVRAQKAIETPKGAVSKTTTINRYKGDLVNHIIQKANKPLSENEAWVRAMIELDNLIWPDGNPGHVCVRSASR